MILSGTKEGCSGSNNDNSLEVPTKTRKSAAKYIQLNLQCFLQYHTRCNMLGRRFAAALLRILAESRDNVLQTLESNPAGRSGPDGLWEKWNGKSFQESISDKYLLERVRRVHQSTGILTVLLINCFCVYAEVDQLPMSKYLTPVVILTQPMRALVSPSVDFVTWSTTDLKAQ